MKSNTPPRFEDFLVAPYEDVASIAPSTLIFAAGGTRRSAILAGISIQSDDYVRWSRQRMMECFDMIFRHGVSHIFSFAIVESQLKEVTGVYRERVLNWAKWGVAGPEALADYGRLGWRVRLLGADKLPEFEDAANRLLNGTPAQSPHTVWWSVVPTADAPWEWVLAAVHKANARTQSEAIRALYGEDIPPADIFLSFGKPFVTPAILPPLLVSNVQCYWTQRPGYSLDEPELRSILYDYAFLRRTWKKDKTGRAEEVLTYRDAWEKGPTIGVGTRIGSLWYPIPIQSPVRTSSDD